MNYFVDGTVGGSIPFEIDQVGLTLWSFYEHVKWIEEAERTPYLESVWPAIERAANLLTQCRDKQNGLQCLANEDDNLSMTQSLHGATTTWLGLASAVRVADFLGRPASAWQSRLDELGAAIDRELHSSDGYLPAGTDTNGAYGAMAWHIFPTRFRDYRDSRMAKTADTVTELARPFFERRTEGGAYHAKATLALAIFAQETGDTRLLVEVRDWIDVLVKDVASPFGHFGESYVDLDKDGDGIGDKLDNRVAIPHLWEGALVYLSLMAAYDVTSVVRPELGEPVADVHGGCACGIGFHDVSPEGYGPMLLFGWIMIRKRRQHA